MGYFLYKVCLGSIIGIYIEIYFVLVIDCNYRNSVVGLQDVQVEGKVWLRVIVIDDGSDFVQVVELFLSYYIKSCFVLFFFCQFIGKVGCISYRDGNDNGVGDV